MMIKDLYPDNSNTKEEILLVPNLSSASSDVPDHPVYVLLIHE